MIQFMKGVTPQTVQTFETVLTVNRDVHDLLVAKGVSPDLVHTICKLAQEGLVHRGGKT